MPWLRNYLNSGRLWPLGLLLSFSLLLSQNLKAKPQVPSQTSSHRNHPQAASPSSQATGQPQFKGVWEPANYKRDINLLDAFFVTAYEGWVSGGAGTILHTRDGGQTWEAQMGGDPQSPGPDLKRLFFLDSKHGWAQAWNQLFRTIDGQNWEPVGNDVRGDAVFVSQARGFRTYDAGWIYETNDGGYTWKHAFQCQASMEVGGLIREEICNVWSVYFSSPSVGYFVGDPRIVVKTEDAGASWRVLVGPEEPGDQRAHSVFFLDPANGFEVRGSQLYRTLDGGQSWLQVAGTVPHAGHLKFADAQVGWVCLGGPPTLLTYTFDGGRRWSSRQFSFPATVHGFSLPRRDRAYVVGDHGMIYRYSVVPTNYQAAAYSIEAPAMPGFDSPVFGEIATLKDVVAKLRAKLPAASGDLQQSSGTGGGGSGAPGPGSFQQDTTSGAAPGSAPTGVGASGFQQDTGTGPVAGGYMDSCCGPLMQQLEATTNSFATNVPAFSQRFRNLNLILEGLNLVNSIVNQANTLKQSVRALRQAKNAQAAAAALTTVQSQVKGISASGGFVQDVSAPLQP